MNYCMRDHAKPALNTFTLREAALVLAACLALAYLGSKWLAYVHTNDMRAQCASRYGGTWIEASKECRK